MMWRYYELLTDVQVPEIEKMKRESHPMQSKKDLARIIVKDFHSQEAAEKAEKDWAKQFQKGDVPEEIEEARVKYEDIQWDPGNAEDIAHSPDGVGFPSAGLNTSELGIRLDRLLVLSGLADSVADAGRKLKASSVKILDQNNRDHEYLEQSPRILIKFSGPTVRLVFRVGKKIKATVIER
jgi:tyrosyl-tRNA synthetase